FGETGLRLSPASLDTLLREKRADLRHAASRGDYAFETAVARRRQRLDRMGADLRPHVVAAKSLAARNRLDGLAARFEQAFGALQERRRMALGAASRMALSLSPLQVLQRGYAIIRDGGDNPVTRAEALVPGMAFEVEFADRRRRSAIAVETGDGAVKAPPAKKPRRESKRASTAELLKADQGRLL
ncbi:MAG: exodeoxyribonuclease VII large subunit, partial [Rhizobiaceae bacterium]|nr:exodeoxyribonuclease VII large subunit [Rhizobiaceae bacterium]